MSQLQPAINRGAQIDCKAQFCVRSVGSRHAAPSVNFACATWFRHKLQSTPHVTRSSNEAKQVVLDLGLDIF